MEESTVLKGQLIELKERFIQKMPDRIEAMASMLASCTDGGSDAMDRLERQFHTLAGTAGTFGLNAVAAAAFDGEEACAEGNRFPLDMRYLSILVDQLRFALAADAPAQWTARTVLIAPDAADGVRGVHRA
jgi:chemotaxis protein histidine kinase CheA